MELFRRAEEGDAEAQGKGVPKDHVQAYARLNLAATKGNEDANKVRALLGNVMTREEIAEAQRLSREPARTIGGREMGGAK